MRVACPRTRPLFAAIFAVWLASAAITQAQFVCDVDPWSQMANSAFGAGPGEIRGFAVTPQSVPAECLVDNNSFLTGVIINASQQGGASTMPIERVDILASSFTGPPSSAEIASGRPGIIEDVPPFPSFVLSRLPTNVAGWDWDLDDNGSLDNWVAPTAYLDGDATPGQFIPFSTNGGMVPCHTGLDGAPIDEPCSDGDPNFRSMGIGIETAAGFAPSTAWAQHRRSSFARTTLTKTLVTNSSSYGISETGPAPERSPWTRFERSTQPALSSANVRTSLPASPSPVR